MGSCRLCLEILLCAGLARAQQEPSPSPSPDANLRAAVAALQAKVPEQGAELSRLRAAVEKPSPGLFRLGGLDLKLFGFVQADAVAYDQSSADELSYSNGAPLNQTRFLVRRARLRI